MSSQLPAILHTIVALALLACYVLVTLAGADANAILGVAGGYIGGAAVERSSSSRSGG